jgi:hypothetical protein
MADQIRYFRNKVLVLEIDPESLWQLIDGKFVLVDDDQYIAVPQLEFAELFYPVNL